MPELPEVETVRRDLAASVLGERIVAVSVTGLRSVRRHADPEEFRARLAGATLTDVGRHGKYLVVSLDTAEHLVAHLRMSGQLLLAARHDPLLRHTHVVLAFESGRELRFVDPRTFGELFVSAGGAPGAPPELAGLGVDALDEGLTWQALAALLAPRRAPVKSVLTDQRALAGIGNIYSDEILFAARVRSDRPASELGPADVRRLHRAMVEVLDGAVRRRGSSLADAQYRDLYGRVGDYQAEHRVYGREGLRCVRCPGTVTRRVHAGRSTFSCLRCQR